MIRKWQWTLTYASVLAPSAHGPSMRKPNQPWNNSQCEIPHELALHARIMAFGVLVSLRDNARAFNPSPAALPDMLELSRPNSSY
jgi:hypothetical protein